MARLDAGSPVPPWTPAQTRAQYAAIAWLRWRILVNSFRRKGGAGELVARIILYPILAGFAIGPTFLAGLGGWYFASHNHFDRIAWLLWVTFILCQILNINLGQPGTTFDPRLLIRFPMRLRSFVAIRLFFGLLSPANVIGTLMSLAVAIGVTIAQPQLWLYALIALAIFAATNVLFSRMVFAWVDRWLSTRRAREIFTGLIFFVSLGFQYLNITFNPGLNRHSHTASAIQKNLPIAERIVQRLAPLLNHLPPELTAFSLAAARIGHIFTFIPLIGCCALYALVFLAIFALRMRTEFRGENLSDAANAVSAPRPRTPSEIKPSLAPTTAIQPSLTHPGFRSTVSAVLGKEFLYLRRNTGLFYSLVAPVVMVFLFAGRIAGRNGSVWTFPIALAYTLLGIVPLSYNSFGLEGAGAQLYFMAPIRLRDVVLAKNLINTLLAAVEMATVLLIVSYVARPPAIGIALSAVFWAAATLLISLAIGNRRSITSPKRIDPGRTTSKQASPLSALLSMGILLLSAALGFGFIFLSRYLHMPWLVLAGTSLLLAIALPTYIIGLQGIDRFAETHREELFTELSKTT
jgi:ABC-2 type transport system permease protein